MWIDLSALSCLKKWLNHRCALQTPAPQAHAELEALYHRTRDARLRTRAQMILLSAEEGLVAHAIARLAEQSVRNWIKRFKAEGIEGLQDQPRPGSPVKVTDEYRERLLLGDVLGRSASRTRSRALERLADFMAVETGIRLSYEGGAFSARGYAWRVVRKYHGTR